MYQSIAKPVLCWVAITAWAAMQTNSLATPPESPTTPGEAPAVDGQFGAIVGVVNDAADTPVAEAVVVLCDHDTGIPLVPETFQTLTQQVAAGGTPGTVAQAVSDDQGQFRFTQLPIDRTYRLIAQKWPATDQVQGVMEVNGVELQLCGVAEEVVVLGDQETRVALKPLGNGVLKIDLQLPNDATLLAIARSPLRGDPILGFAAWGGSFMQSLLGGNRMPHGATTVRGLPPGMVHVALFAADNAPGWGAASVNIEPDETHTVDIPIVAAWSNGVHEPPDRLRPLLTQVRTLQQKSGFSLSRALDAHGIKSTRNVWAPYGHLVEQWQHEIELGEGVTGTIADLLAVDAYLRLQDYRRRVAAAASPQRSGSAEVGYAEAFRDLYRELGDNYPCFQLKQIDWPAVGEEMLPRAEQIQDDEQFGLLCAELIARLEDSHAMLLAGTADLPTIDYPRWDPGLACLIDDHDEPVVYYVDDGGPAEQVGIRPGMTVVSVNGVNSRQELRNCMTKAKRYQGFSSDRYLRYQAARWFLRQAEPKTEVTLQLRDPEGQSHTYRVPALMDVRYLPRLPVPIPGVQDTADVSWTRLDGNVGYIYVRRIQKDLIPELDKAVEQLQDTQGLIIDVRGNSGGGFDATRAHRNFDPQDQSDPDRPRFSGRIALLIDARCISAGEGWASWFVARRRARLFGEATAGASARKTNYQLRNGKYLARFPVKAYRGYLGRPIERVGLVPDVACMQKAQDLAIGRDTVLEAAKSYLLGLNGNAM